MKANPFLFHKFMYTIWTSLIAQLVKNLPAMKETDSFSGLRRSPGEGKDYPF